jgi:chromosome partitioning protein
MLVKKSIRRRSIRLPRPWPGRGQARSERKSPVTRSFCLHASRQAGGHKVKFPPMATFPLRSCLKTRLSYPQAPALTKQGFWTGCVGGASDVKTLAVISRKGGAGKTTLSVNLTLTAHLAGWKTLLADIDPQRSATDALRARGVRGPTVAEINAGKLFQARSQAIHDAYDVMLIDTPAAPDADVAVAVNSADLCVLVCRPTFLDIASVARSAEMVRRLGKAGLIVLNQAPSKRAGTSPPACSRPSRPCASAACRSRRSACARAPSTSRRSPGASVGEWDPASPAAQEVDAPVEPCRRPADPRRPRTRRPRRLKARPRPRSLSAGLDFRPNFGRRRQIIHRLKFCSYLDHNSYGHLGEPCGRENQPPGLGKECKS